MTCIKTGARVYFENYGIIAAADLYTVGDTIIIRWTPQSYNQATREDIKQATHSVFLRGSDLWHREDLGVTVVPSHMIRTLPQPEESSHEHDQA